MVQRLFFASLFVGALLGTGHPALAQTPPPDAAGAAAAVAEIRQTIDAAWKDVQAYRSGGGKPATPDHPALKWHATLWAYREQHPGTEAAARATADAIRLLVRGEFWEQAHARTEVVGADDPAWERLSAAIYEEGSDAKRLRVHACHALEGCRSHDQPDHQVGGAPRCRSRAATAGRRGRREGVARGVAIRSARLRIIGGSRRRSVRNRPPERGPAALRHFPRKAGMARPSISRRCTAARWSLSSGPRLERSA